VLTPHLTQVGPGFVMIEGDRIEIRKRWRGSDEATLEPKPGRTGTHSHRQTPETAQRTAGLDLVATDIIVQRASWLLRRGPLNVRAAVRLSFSCCPAGLVFFLVPSWGPPLLSFSGFLSRYPMWVLACPLWGLQFLFFLVPSLGSSISFLSCALSGVFFGVPKVGPLYSVQKRTIQGGIPQNYSN